MACGLKRPVRCATLAGGERKWVSSTPPNGVAHAAHVRPLIVFACYRHRRGVVLKLRKSKELERTIANEEIARRVEIGFQHDMLK